MIKIDVFIKEKKWKKHISNPKKYLENKINNIKFPIKLIKKKNVNFSVLLAGNHEIKILNNKFRKKNKTTDVLSFPFYKKEQIKKIKNKKSIYIGDIILNYYKKSKTNFKRDFNELWIHGFLHLLGHKHYYQKDFNKMNKLENLILKEVEKH